MSNATSIFNGNVIKDIGSIPISRTQEIRVILVKGDKSPVSMSVQKWWRPSTNDEWRVGKGFTFTMEDAPMLKELIGASIDQFAQCI